MNDEEQDVIDQVDEHLEEYESIDSGVLDDLKDSLKKIRSLLKRVYWAGQRNGWKDGHEQGEKEGLALGQEQGESEGRSEGFKEGYKLGRYDITMGVPGGVRGVDSAY